MVSLVYEAPSFRAGAWVSGVAALLVTALLLVALWHKPESRLTTSVEAGSSLHSRRG